LGRVREALSGAPPAFLHAAKTPARRRFFYRPHTAEKRLCPSAKETISWRVGLRFYPQRGCLTDWFGIGMSDIEKRNGTEGPNTGVIVKPKAKTKKPAMYKVLMLNDDYTPMEFVVHILERFFNKNREEATRIMMHVHRRGVGVCGVYTYEVAETKVTQVMDFARQHQHPLQCTLEKD
jgi:ATP-dependent Clp protease adaptor protein ClpS